MSEEEEKSARDTEEEWQQPTAGLTQDDASPTGHFNLTMIRQPNQIPRMSHLHRHVPQPNIVLHQFNQFNHPDPFHQHCCPHLFNSAPTGRHSAPILLTGGCEDMEALSGEKRASVAKSIQVKKKS